MGQDIIGEGSVPPGGPWSFVGLIHGLVGTGGLYCPSPHGRPGAPMQRLRLVLIGFCLACVAQAAPYLPPGSKPDPFVAYAGPSIALTGATLIDGTGAPPKAGMTVLI